MRWNALKMVASTGLAVVLSGGFIQGQTKSAVPTFYKNILPILQDHCQSCHRAEEVAPMPLTTYEQARVYVSAMAHDVQMKMMPPWFADPHYGRFVNDPSLTED